MKIHLKFNTISPDGYITPNAENETEEGFLIWRPDHWSDITCLCPQNPLYRLTVLRLAWLGGENIFIFLILIVHVLG